jgi:hypothetical protein
MNFIKYVPDEVLYTLAGVGCVSVLYCLQSVCRRLILSSKHKRNIKNIRKDNIETTIIHTPVNIEKSTEEKDIFKSNTPQKIKQVNITPPSTQVNHKLSESTPQLTVYIPINPSPPIITKTEMAKKYTKVKKYVH